MPENMKRKITVESSSSKKDSQPRPSVFDRLGKKSSTSTVVAVIASNESSGICRHWAAAGNCPYGKNCKYAGTHTLISPSKQRAAKKDIVDTKQKTNTSTTHTVSTLKPGIPSKEDISKRLHSAVVRKGRTGTGGSPDLNWENWDQTDLEYEDEKVLEKRRQLLQRELELQMSKEKDDHQKKKKVKKVKEVKGVSSSSSTSASSSSSTESTSSSDDSSSTSSSTSIDSRKKKTKKNSKRDSSSSTSGTDHATSKKKSSKSAKSGSLTSSKKTPPAHKEDHRLSSKVQETSTSKKPVSASANQTVPSTKKRSTTPQERSKRRSQTPPHSNDNLKEKMSGAVKKSSTSGSKHNLSPVAKRPPSVDRKTKRNQSRSPHSLGRERDKEKAKSKDHDKDRDKDRERDKEREAGRGQGRNGSPTKGKAKDRVASPKRNSRPPRDPRKRDSPEPPKDKRSRVSPPKPRRSSSRGRIREEGSDKRASTKSAPSGSRDTDRRDASRNDSRDSRGAVKNSDRDIKKNDDVSKVTKSNKDTTKSTSSSGRGRDDVNTSRRSENTVVSSRETGRKMLPAPAAKSGIVRDLPSKGDKDRSKDPRDTNRDNRSGRDNARDGRGTNKDSVDPRLPRNTKNIRDMREAEREKEREEALERCRERQRERERKAQERERKDQERDRKVHEQEKAREHERELPSLLMIATHNPIKSVRNGGREDSKGHDKGSERGSDRSHEKDRASDRDRDLDKGIDRDRTNDRGSDRDRGPPSRAVERDRDRERVPERSANDKDRDRGSDRNADRNHDRDRGPERERGFDRSLDHERPLERDRGLDRGASERDRGQDRERTADRGPPDRDRTFDRGLDRPQNKSPHNRGMNRGPSDRNYDRNADHSFEREPDRIGFDRDNRDGHSEREYPPLGRGRDDVRRPPLGPEDKGSGYDSPYDARRGREERGRYSDQIERTRYDEPIGTREDPRRPGPDPRNYPDDRRGRRELRASLEPAWEGRNRESPEGRRRPGYGDEPRSPPPPVKGRGEWDNHGREYADGRREWDGRGGARRGPPLDWDNQRRGEWLEKDSTHPPLDEEWDMYAGPNAPPDWPGGPGERWPAEEWDRPPRGTPNRQNRPPPLPQQHRDEPVGQPLLLPPPRDIKLEEPVKLEDVKKEPLEVFPPAEQVVVKEEEADPIKAADAPETVPTPKRPLDSSESEIDKPVVKKICLEESVPLEEDLSDISDDDADEILNREDIELASQAATHNEENLPQPPAAVVTNGCSDSIKTEPDQEKESERFDKSADLTQHDLNRDVADQSGLHDDETMDNLDFEEISDEELEEDAKAGLADALGVDWASLVAECRPRGRPDAAPGSARRRWEGHRMLARIGVSLRYAGRELVDRVAAKFDEINKEEGAAGEDAIEFLHPVAAIHVVLGERRRRRRELLASAGPYERALSARRDLLIRRQLCNLPVSEITVESQSQNTDEIYRLAIQLFERDVVSE